MKVRTKDKIVNVLTFLCVSAFLSAMFTDRYWVAVGIIAVYVIVLFAVGFIDGTFSTHEFATAQRRQLWVMTRLGLPAILGLAFTYVFTKFVDVPDWLTTQLILRAMLISWVLFFFLVPLALNMHAGMKIRKRRLFEEEADL